MKIDSAYNPIYNLNANLSSSFDRTAGLEEQMREAADEMDFDRMLILIERGAHACQRVEITDKICRALIQSIVEDGTTYGCYQLAQKIILDSYLTYDQAEFDEDSIGDLRSASYDLRSGFEWGDKPLEFDTSEFKRLLLENLDWVSHMCIKTGRGPLNNTYAEMTALETTPLQLVTLTGRVGLVKAIVERGVAWEDNRFFWDGFGHRNLIVPSNFLFKYLNPGKALDIIELFHSMGCPAEDLVPLNSDFFRAMTKIEIKYWDRILGFLQNHRNLKDYLFAKYPDNDWYEDEESYSDYYKDEYKDTNLALLRMKLRWPAREKSLVKRLEKIAFE